MRATLQGLAREAQFAVPSCLTPTCKIVSVSSAQAAGYDGMWLVGLPHWVGKRYRTGMGFSPGSRRDKGRSPRTVKRAKAPSGDALVSNLSQQKVRPF